jgi:uncharacterized protein (DUF2252 family)
MEYRLIDRNHQHVWQLIQAANRHRDEGILTQKYVKMQKNAFAFFRGTCHLFYQDLPATSSLNSAPPVWICGDLHLENFGTYKGDDRQIYFGINDFDEGVLAPFTWDLARLLTSIFLLPIDRSDRQQLAATYLTSYTNILSTGKIKQIGADNTSGVVAKLIKELSRRKRSDLLAERVESINGRPRLVIDNQKILKISDRQKDQITTIIDRWAKTQPDPAFFQVLDVGFRLAGTGSLGLDRYLILVAGKGAPDRHYLLDFKQQPPSTLESYVPNQQPQWSNSATRVMQIQKLAQLAPPALLAAIEFNEHSFLLRELQPTQDKITIKANKISLDQLDKLIHTMAEVTAYTHLHGSGKLGATIDRELIACGQNSDWQQAVRTYASNYAKQVKQDHQDFCQATQYLSLS